MTAPTIYFLEGEAKADLLASWGLVATCLDTGAESKWKASYTPFFKGRHVVIVPDNDQAGAGCCATVAKGLYEVAASVKVLRLPGLPEKGDVLDWIETHQATTRPVFWNLPGLLSPGNYNRRLKRW